MAESAVGLPPPPKLLDATLVTCGAGLEFHRVDDLAFGGSEFKTSAKGNARFSPITDDAGTLILNALHRYYPRLRPHGGDLPRSPLQSRIQTTLQTHILDVSIFARLNNCR